MKGLIWLNVSVTCVHIVLLMYVLSKVHQFQSDVQYMKHVVQSTGQVLRDTWDVTTGGVSQKLNVIRRNGKSVTDKLKSWYNTKKTEL